MTEIDWIYKHIISPFKIFFAITIKSLGAILGIILLAVVILNWLTFFGIIPSGESPDYGRYTPEMSDPFH